MDIVKARIYPKSIIGTNKEGDSYYYAKSSIDIKPFGRLGGVGDSYSFINRNDDVENYLLPKAKESRKERKQEGKLRRQARKKTGREGKRQEDRQERKESRKKEKYTEDRKKVEKEKKQESRDEEKQAGRKIED